MAKKIIEEKPLELTYVNPQDVEQIGPRDILEVQSIPVIIPGYEDMGTPPDLSIEVPIVLPTETIVEPTIYDKYEKIINSFKDGVVRDVTYATGMDILRYCEKQINQQIPMNFSCSTCVYDLIKLFVNLKNK